MNMLMSVNVGTCSERYVTSDLVVCGHATCASVTVILPLSVTYALVLSSVVLLLV